MFKSQFYSMVQRRGFQFSFLFALFIGLLYPIILVLEHLIAGFDIASLVDPRFAYIANRYTESWDYMYEFLPLILMFPFAYSYASDKRTHYDYVVISRGGIKKYLYSKALCCLLGGFIVVFFPLVVNIVVNYIFLPHTNNGQLYNSLTDEIFGIVDTHYYTTKSKDSLLWITAPKLCFFLSAIRMGVLGATFSLVIFVISMLIKNSRYFYFSVLPVLLFFVASHKIQESRSLDLFSIELMDYATAGSYSAFAPLFFWGVCGLLIAVSFIVIFVFTKKDQL